MRVKTYEVALEPEDREDGSENTTRTVAADEEDPSVETYDVAVEDHQIVIYI